MRARFERVNHDLQAVRELDEAEQPEHSHDQKHTHDVFLVKQVDVERDDGEEVQPVHRSLEKLELRRAEDEAHDQLEREEHAADRLDLPQRGVVADAVGWFLLHVRQRAQAEDPYRQTDEEAGEVRHELRRK